MKFTTCWSDLDPRLPRHCRILRPQDGCLGRTPLSRPGTYSTDTSVALIIAKTLSPSLRFIRSTEPVVIIDVTFPAAVRIRTSDTTLSETIFSIVPARRFRMLVLTVGSFPQVAD